ncbi:carboxylesterase [Aspergillus sclerotiicarbonarius CBS 121057]|uniref:Carboxylic ester hydrolase n=1 Tax=Aspergillus sclerotiicarbonarius (strain CBS 121057 / IBT 28362) TaxID=1448318 RepID=A0A319DY87_ASPSB|nr:carboxylesterase [Aspergillus sclerotiicarbonarius CBS 121057]
MASLLLALPARAKASSASTAFLFENNGNWTAHAERPSALLVHQTAHRSQAEAICVEYGEKLLGCNDVDAFRLSFQYQQYLGTFPNETLLWTACNSPVDLDGLPASGNTSSSDEWPFVCTNSAPLVDRVDTDYSSLPRVNATAGNITFEGLRDHLTFRFAGIPFAQPPLDARRFQYAQPWNATNVSYVNATQYSPACLQLGYFEGNSYGLNPWGNDEDCLYLNVYTPFLPGGDVTDDQLKPVLFWIHGGGFSQGTGSDLTFDGGSLTSRSDVVVVTSNYRLNIFGYLSLDDGIIPGNYWMSDNIAALQWVQKYIRGFGGNPNNVTIFGQSAGGANCIELVSSPQAAGLFQGVIQQSAGNGRFSTQEAIAELAEPYLTPYCNETGVSRLACLQQLPASLLLNASADIFFTPVIDPVYLPDAPMALIAQGSSYINSVRMMTTLMPEETQSLTTTTLAPNMTDFQAALDLLIPGGWIDQEQADHIIPSGLWLISNETFHNGSVSYPSVYNASIKISTETNQECPNGAYAMVGASTVAFPSIHVAYHQRGYALSYYDFYDLCTFPVDHPDTPYYRCHSSDLYEVFGTYYIFDQPIRVPEDIFYTNAVQDMWGSFARTGNPNVPADYLAARGYESTIAFFADWHWPEFTASEMVPANLQYPGPGYTNVPDLEHCRYLAKTQY